MNKEEWNKKIEELIKRVNYHGYDDEADTKIYRLNDIMNDLLELLKEEESC